MAWTGGRSLKWQATFLALALALQACDGGNGEGGDKGEPRQDPHIKPNPGKFKDNPETLSPPIVLEPLYECATAVTVQGFIPGAKIDVFANGAPIGGGVSDSPWGQSFSVAPALVKGQAVTAAQTFGPATSLPSKPVVVRSHTEDYPDGVPAPRIDPTPLYRCGKATGARDVVPGSLLEILSETPSGGGGFDPPVQVGKVNGSGAAQAVGINPPFIEGARVTASYQLCAETSPLSAPQIVQPPPATIPAPSIEQPVYEGATHVILHNVVNGAVVEVSAGGTPVGGQACSGGGQVVGINPPAAPAKPLSAKQTLCDSSPQSPDVPVQPCSALPAAEIEPPAAGDEQIHVTKSVLSSRILIFADGEEVGDGGGPLIQLTRPLRPGEVVVVVQRLGDCESSWIYEIPVECKVVRELADPSGSGPFAVGVLDYQLPAIPIGSDNVRLWATVRYPALTAGTDTELIPLPKRLPLVVFLHGNHGIFRDGDEDLCVAPAGTPEVPNHAGYNFALESLARGGFIAISINANDLNCKPGRIHERGALILQHLALWKKLDDAGQADPLFSGKFHGRVDLGKIGLAGHSRGGEAVVAAVLDNSDPTLGIRSVLSIAPVDFHSLTLSGVPLLMLLPAGDGDVWDNSGAKIYDRALPGGANGWFKSQMYVYGTIHDFFNREWRDEWEDDGLTVPDLLSRPGHEAMLKAWARTFFELTLKGKEVWRPVMAGDSVLKGLQNQRVFPSYQRAGARIVDHLEDVPDDVAHNSLNGKVEPTGFAIFDEFEFRQASADQYNDTFFHDTDGLVAVWREKGATFTSEIPAAHADNSTFEYLSIRVTQVMDKLNDPPGPMSLGIGLEDLDGVRVGVASTAVGVIPYPYEHPWGRKSMIRTLRVPLVCFDEKDAKPVSRDKVRLIHIPVNASDGVVGMDQFEFTH